MTGAAVSPPPGFDPRKAGELRDSAGDIDPQRSLSTRDWDPDNPVFDQDVISDLRDQLGSLRAGIIAQRDNLDGLGPEGLVSDGNVAIPERWAETRGSPAYYLRVAEGYVSAAIQGTVCRKAHPPSSRSEHPPPAGRWCCEHQSPHCE